MWATSQEYTANVLPALEMMEFAELSARVTQRWERFVHGN
jgi:hypothetical protein